MRRRFTAAFALGSFVLALLLPSVTASHVWADADLGTGLGLAAAGRPAAQVDGSRPAESDEHCALCHWLRNLGNSLTAGPEPIADLTAVDDRQQSLPSSTVAAIGDGGPARAPPLPRFA